MPATCLPACPGPAPLLERRCRAASCGTSTVLSGGMSTLQVCRPGGGGGWLPHAAGRLTGAA